MARRRTKWWLWLLGLPLIIGAAAHWGLYFYTQYRLENYILGLSSQARISYAELSTDLRGRFNVSGIEIQPVGQKTLFKIDRITLNTLNVWQAIKQYNPINGKKGPPTFLRFDIENIRVPLNQQSVRFMDQIRSDSQKPEVGQFCETTSALHFSDLYLLGYKQLLVNASGGYHFNPQKRTLASDLLLDAKSMWHMSLNLALENIENLTSELGWLGVRLKELNLSNNIHPSLGKMLSRFCAEKNHLSLNTWETLAANRFIENLAHKGIDLGWSIREVVKDYFINWGTLDILIKPKPAISLLGLPRIPPEKLRKQLGLSLRINNRLIKDAEIRFNQEAMNEISPSSDNPEKKKPVEKKPAIRYEWVFKTMNMAALPGYLGHPIRLRTQQGIWHEGTLADVSADQVSVQKTVSGGKFIAHIMKPTIAEVQVSVRVKREIKN